MCERLETLAENLESCNIQLGQCSNLQRAALQKQASDSTTVNYDKLLEESKGENTANGATKVLSLINKKIEGIRLTRTETYYAAIAVASADYSTKAPSLQLTERKNKTSLHFLPNRGI